MRKGNDSDEQKRTLGTRDDTAKKSKASELSDECFERAESLEGLMHSRNTKSVGALPKYEVSPPTHGKKGKYGVTVPRPFQFDIRDKVRPKTIREVKIDEMVE